MPIWKPLMSVLLLVVQYTTLATRIEAHLSAIPHWFYYTPLRKEQPVWIEFMIWSSIIGTVGALIGIVTVCCGCSGSCSFRYS